MDRQKKVSKNGQQSWAILPYARSATLHSPCHATAGAADWPETSTRRQSTQQARQRRFGNAGDIAHDQDGEMEGREMKQATCRENWNVDVQRLDTEASMGRQGS